LDDAWAYFKTWVKGMPVSEAVNFNHSTTNDFDRSLFGPKMPSQMMENNPVDDAAPMDYADPDTEPTKPDIYSEFKPYTGEGKSYKPTTGESKPNPYDSSSENADKVERSRLHELQKTREKHRRMQEKRAAETKARNEAEDDEVASRNARMASKKAKRAAAAAAQAKIEDEDRVETARRVQSDESKRSDSRARQLQAEAVADEKEKIEYAALQQRQHQLAADNTAKATAAEDECRTRADEHARQVEAQKNDIQLKQQAQEKSILNSRLNETQYNLQMNQAREQAEVQQGQLALAAVTRRNELHLAANNAQYNIQLEAIQAFFQYRSQAEACDLNHARQQASANNAEFDRINAMSLEFQQGERNFQSALASNAYVTSMRENIQKMFEYYGGEFIRQRHAAVESMRLLQEQWNNTENPAVRETLMIKMKEEDKSSNVILLGYREEAQLDMRQRLQDFSTQQDTTLTIYKQEKAAVVASKTVVQKMQMVSDGSPMDTDDVEQSKPSQEEITIKLDKSVNEYIRRISDLIDSGSSSDGINLEGSTSISAVQNKYEGDLDVKLYYNDVTTEKIIDIINASSAPDGKKAAMIEALRDAQINYRKLIDAKREKAMIDVNKAVKKMVKTKKKKGKSSIITV